VISRLLKFSVSSFLAGVLFVGAAALSPVIGQTGGGSVIEEIRVVGTQRIDPTTVNSYMQLKPGDIYSPEKVDESLKNLFNTGLFADVTLRREGRSVVVQVVENPIINRIAFEGNRKLNDEVLETEVTLRPRVVYTRTKVQSDVQRLLDVYRRSGRFAATVDPKVIQLPENRVDLVFEINEGGATGIRAINFIGNAEFSMVNCATSFRRRNPTSIISCRATTHTIPIACPSTANCCAGSISPKVMPIFVCCPPSRS
jgi:outer membrane protein assembly factor BamA